MMTVQPLRTIFIAGIGSGLDGPPGTGQKPVYFGNMEAMNALEAW